MSKLKNKKMKKFTKNVVSSLALALLMSSTQIIPTYALFTDTIKIANDLVISMGKLDVNIGDGFNEKELEVKNEVINNTFKITNDGTLKQHLKLSLSGIDNNIKKYLDYNIEFENYNDKTIKPISYKQLLNNNLVSLKYEDDSLVVLEPGKFITATANIVIDENIPQDLIEQPLKFNLNINAIQVNNETLIQDFGFSDIEIQKNYLQFKDMIEPELPQNGNINVQLVSNEDKVKIFIRDIKEINTKNIRDIEITGGTGEFNNIKIVQDNDNIVFVQKDSQGNFNITNTDFDDSNTLILKLIMNDKSYKEIKFRFRINSKNSKKLEAYYEIISSGTVEVSSILNESEVVELPKDEEIEVPNEPEVVELSKDEEIGVPNEPEVVEPSKDEEIGVPNEPEVVEPSKDEEIGVPNEPEVVEPPKDQEIEVPNELEIVELPNNIEGIQG